MSQLIDDSRPIFAQIAERIENDILEGELPEETQVPSTNQFASFYHINPATVAKGVNQLVEQGILSIAVFICTRFNLWGELFAWFIRQPVYALASWMALAIVVYALATFGMLRKTTV